MFDNHKIIVIGCEQNLLNAQVVDSFIYFTWPLKKQSAYKQVTGGVGLGEQCL